MKQLESLLEIEVASADNVVTCLALSQRFGSIYALSTNDGAVSIYVVGGSEPSVCFQSVKAGDRVVALVFDVSEELLLAAYASGDICVWDIEAEEMVRHWSVKTQCIAATFHPSGKIVALLAATQIELWDLSTKCLVHVYALPEQNRPSSTLAFSPDGVSLVCGATETGKASALIFDLERGIVVHSLTDAADPRASICSLAFHPEEAVLMTGSTSGKVTFWDFVNFVPLATEPGKAPANQLVWSHDGSCAMAMVLNEVIVWDTAKLTAIQVANRLNFEGRANFAQITFGFDSFVIVTNCSAVTLDLLFYNLQYLGLCQSNAKKAPSEAQIDTPNKTIENDAENDEDDALLTQITSSKALYTLRNRLDHLKSIRSTLIGKSGPTIWQAISKQAVATRPELIGELLCGRIIEVALNITPSTVGPKGLTASTADDLTNFLSLLKSNLHLMSEGHQHASLDYLQQLVNDLIDVCPEKFDSIQEELQNIISSISDSTQDSESHPASSIAVIAKAKAIIDRLGK